MSASLHLPKVDILIVDDTINNINLLSTMLSVEGYGVRKALNGQMALRAAQTVVPDLILLDINMPEMDGYQVCKHLKDIPETAMVPVIFLSALDDVLDKVKAFQVGGVDYITKPFQIEEVMARIQNQLTIRQLQTQLEQSNSELQQALQDLKTTQVQLIQKEKMIGLGQLIAGIAHEINNPISFISCNLAPAREYIHDLLHILKLYQQTYPTPEPDLANAIARVELPFLTADLTKMMSSMQAGADRIRSIVLALRIFSRLGESDLKAVDVHEGIDSTLLLLQHRLRAESKRSKIQVIREYGDIPVLTCYASLVNQVFLHLLNNAIDALEERRQTHTDARIWIRTTTEAGMVVIAIRDNGVGMPEQVRSRIYEPFFTTKPIGQGSGLGLSASYQIIVEKHGGQLSCSAPGDGGTEFVIQLPSQPKTAEQRASA